MCILPNRSTQGPTPPRMTIWEAIAEAFRGGRWYDAVSRPDRERQS